MYQAIGLIYTLSIVVYGLRFNGALEHSPDRIFYSIYHIYLDFQLIKFYFHS